MSTTVEEGRRVSFVESEVSDLTGRGVKEASSNALSPRVKRKSSQSSPRSSSSKHGGTRSGSPAGSRASPSRASSKQKQRISPTQRHLTKRLSSLRLSNQSLFSAVSSSVGTDGTARRPSVLSQPRGRRLTRMSSVVGQFGGKAMKRSWQRMLSRTNLHKVSMLTIGQEEDEDDTKKNIRENFQVQASC